GTYALSAGYHDAYYGQAQKVRTLVRQDFEKAFARVDVLAAPTTPGVAFRHGEKADPLAMYMNDVYTIPARTSRPAGGAGAVGLRRGPPADRLAADRSDARRGDPAARRACLRAGHAVARTAPESGMSTTPATTYETVIGLEVHAQLATRSKMFCACPTTFGAPPNSQTCPICLGMPGTLPVINRQAVEFAVRTALALECRVNAGCRFARKHYYYPDMPKNFQISQ